jgi:hypothetical protein
MYNFLAKSIYFYESWFKYILLAKKLYFQTQQFYIYNSKRWDIFTMLTSYIFKHAHEYTGFWYIYEHAGYATWMSTHGEIVGINSILRSIFGKDLMTSTWIREYISDVLETMLPSFLFGVIFFFGWMWTSRWVTNVQMRVHILSFGAASSLLTCELQAWWSHLCVP